MKSNRPLYPIREVSRLTGVNSITLRAWERRYALIEPIRTESGHRLYTQAHIDRIKSAVKLTEQGIPISRVKHLLDEREAEQSVQISADDWDYPHQLLQRVKSYDLPGLQQELDALFSDLSDDQASQVIRLVTQELTDEPAQYETFWSAVIMPRLFTKLRFLTRTQPEGQGKCFWVQPATEGCHEVMVLLVATWFARQGDYPIVQSQLKASEPFPFEMLKSLHCEGLVVVDDSGQFEEESWLLWTQQHPTLEFHYFVDQDKSAALGKQLQAHHHDLKSVF